MGAEVGAKSTHIPALDGLRAIGIMAVIAYHYEVPGYRGGLLSIDVFFVLSGFLITTLLLREHTASSGIDLGRFWSRRLRRLMPASLLMISAVALWAWSQVPSGQLDRVRGDLLSTIGYAANWRFIVTGQSYFDFLGEPSVVRHAWSLAIEEQFYLVWPVLVLVLLRLGRGKRRWLLGFSVVVASASATAMWFLYDPSNPSRAYYGTDSRVVQILIGAILAMVVAKGRRSVPRAVPEITAFLSFAVVMVALFTIEKSYRWLFEGGYVAFSFVTAALVWAVSGETETVVGRLLSWRPLTMIGDISYGLYLWHWPVQIAISEQRTGLDGWTLIGVRLAVTIAISVLSFVLIETPVRRFKGWGVLGGWRSPVAIAGAMMVAVGTTVIAAADATPPPKYLAGSTGEVAEEGDSTGGSGRRILLAGDSLTLSLSDGAALVAQERSWGFGMVSRWGCGVLDLAPEESVCHREHAAYIDRIVAADAPIIVWMSNLDNVVGLYTQPPVIKGAYEEYFDLFAEIDSVASRFIDSGSHVVFIIPPRSAPPAPLSITADFDAGLLRSERVFRAYQRLHSSSTSVLDLSEAICGDAPRCPAVVDGIDLRAGDGVHFSSDGARWVAGWLFDQLESLDIVATNQSSNQPK